MYFMYLCTLNFQIFSTNNLFSLVWDTSTKSWKELFKESINLEKKKKKIRMTLKTATLILIYVAESLREHKNVWKILFVTIKAMVFSSSHVWLWELDLKEDWALKNWCFQTVVLVKTLENPLDCKIQSVNPKGNQPWTFIGRTDAEAPIFGHLMWRVTSLEKILMLRKIEGKMRRGQHRMNEMVRYHHRLSGHEFEQIPGDSGGQRSLACYSLWGHKELDTT